MTSLLIFLSLAVILKFATYLYRLNYLLLFVLVDAVLIATKRKRGRLQRNIALLDVMMKNWWGQSNTGGVVIGSAGASYYGGGSSGGFGGFGGGDFGGGGAGGNW